MRILKISLLSVVALAAVGFVCFWTACPKGKDAIIGIWQEREDTNYVIEFRPEGTYLCHDSFGTKSLTYSWAGPDRIRIQVNDSTLPFGVTCKRNVLALTNLNEWVGGGVTRHRRLKRGDVPKLDLDDFKGAELVRLPVTSAPEQVVEAFFQKGSSGSGKVTSYKILKQIRVVTSRGAPFVAEVDTGVGRKTIYLEPDWRQIGVAGPLRGWWCRVEDTRSAAWKAPNSSSHE